jgi:hypothetical protein
MCILLAAVLCHALTGTHCVHGSEPLQTATVATHCVGHELQAQSSTTFAEAQREFNSRHYQHTAPLCHWRESSRRPRPSLFHSTTPQLSLQLPCN